MEKYICTTCGTEYPPLDEPPLTCLICSEERQYINPNGQSWTTLDEMQKSESFCNEITQEEAGLFSVTTRPRFGIGQTAYLVQTDGFQMLWDCTTYLDEKTLAQVKNLGGLQAIALSHPHYYSTQVEWAEAFDVPIFIHEDDKQWAVYPSDYIKFWSGESLRLSEGLEIHRLGGHFKGGSVLHWENGATGKGVLLTGDVIQVVADENWVSFMYSYPNLIPLPSKTVSRIAERTVSLPFDRIYNAFHRTVRENAKESVRKSAARYIAAIEGKLFTT